MEELSMTIPMLHGLFSLLRRLVPISIAVFLLSCTSLKNEASVEIFQAGKSTGRSFCLLDTIHGLNPAMEQVIAGDLKSALSKRGFGIPTDFEKADLILIPTLGRVRIDPEGKPAIQSGPVDPRPRYRAPSSQNIGMTMASVSVPRHSQSQPPDLIPKWQAGLLLTAIDKVEYEKWDPNSETVPALWRAYACMPISDPSWRKVCKPLTEAVAESVSKIR
jgi:hypothetical protein